LLGGRNGKKSCHRPSKTGEGQKIGWGGTKEAAKTPMGEETWKGKKSNNYKTPKGLMKKFYGTICPKDIGGVNHCQEKDKGKGGLPAGKALVSRRGGQKGKKKRTSWWAGTNSQVENQGKPRVPPRAGVEEGKPKWGLLHKRKGSNSHQFVNNKKLNIDCAGGGRGDKRGGLL